MLAMVPFHIQLVEVSLDLQSSIVGISALDADFLVGNCDPWVAARSAPPTF